LLLVPVAFADEYSRLLARFLGLVLEGVLSSDDFADEIPAVFICKGDRN
jgi:hypothetical protein